MHRPRFLACPPAQALRQCQLNPPTKENVMHYRNGREAKNGDKIVKLENGKVVAFGVLHSATPGNDYCNGNIASIQPVNDYACMVDCLHVDDVEKILKEKSLHQRPAGK